MSMMPEYILQQLVIKGVNAFRADNRLIAFLFRNANRSFVEQAIEFVQKHPINVSIGWSQTAVIYPHVAIVLKGSTEKQGFLGNLVTESEDYTTAPSIFTYDDTSVGTLRQTKTILYGPYEASGGGTNYIVVDDVFTDKRYIGYSVEVIGGTGKSRVSTITDMGQDTLYLETTYSSAFDETTVYQISDISTAELIGEPMRIFSGDDIVETYGYEEHLVYDLNICCSNPEQKLVLTALVRALVLSNYDSFERNGLRNITMAVADLASIPENYPDITYGRQLTLEFDTMFTTARVFTNDGASAAIGLDVIIGNAFPTTEVTNTSIELE